MEEKREREQGGSDVRRPKSELALKRKRAAASKMYKRGVSIAAKPTHVKLRDR